MSSSGMCRGLGGFPFGAVGFGCGRTHMVRPGPNNHFVAGEREDEGLQWCFIIRAWFEVKIVSGRKTGPTYQLIEVIDHYELRCGLIKEVDNYSSMGLILGVGPYGRAKCMLF